MSSGGPSAFGDVQRGGDEPRRRRLPVTVSWHRWKSRKNFNFWRAGANDFDRGAGVGCRCSIHLPGWFPGDPRYGVLISLLKRFRECDRAATAIEYALVGSLIMLVIVGSVTPIGTSLEAIFDDINTNGFN